MSDIDVNKIQQNVKELQDQNAIDFQQWKKLGKDIEKLSEKIKLSDTNLNMLMKKIKNDYEKMKKIIIDENIQVQLNNKIEQNKNEIVDNKNKIDYVKIKAEENTNKIEENKNEINKKVNIETFENKVDEISSQLDNITPNLFETTGNIVFLNGAYGDGESHKASSLFSDLEKAKLIYPTIVTLNDELDQLAIEKTLSQTNNVKIPKGTFLLNRSLKIKSNQIITGYNKTETVFKMVSDNTPIILLNGDAIRLSNLKLIYKNIQNITHTNSHGILQNIKVMNFLELNFIQIENCHSGIRGIGNWFNCSVKNIRINGYSCSSLWLDGSGSTGCYFENIYTTNWSNWVIREKYSVSTACHIQGFSECVINQLNIEHVICNQALLLNDNGNVVINSMHIEGQEQKLGTGGALISLLSNTHAIINGLTVSFSGFRTDDYKLQDYNLCNLGKNTKLTFNDVHFHKMNQIETWNGSSVEVVKLPTTNLHNNGRIRMGIKPNMSDPCQLSINGFRDDSDFWTTNVINLNMNNYPYDIININEKYYYRENNGAKEVYRNARLDSGIWLAGDKNIFTTIIDGFNYIGEICTGGGNFATPSTGLTCTVVPWQNNITIDNGQTYKLNKGDRIKIEGVKTSEGNDYFTITSDLYNDNKYNVKEVIGNFDLSNCEIKIAPPEFKGFGEISS